VIERDHAVRLDAVGIVVRGNFGRTAVAPASATRRHAYGSVGTEPYVGQDGTMSERNRNRDPMRAGEAMASVARLLADDTRATFCLALLDGRAWTVTELARHAGVAASTASEHTSRLIAGGLLAGERQGRHRYVRIATPDVANLIEMITAAAGRQPPAISSLAGATRRTALTRARTCYDHLAGRLGVAISDAMTDRGLVSWEHGLAVTPAGEAWLATLGLTAEHRPPTRRPVLRSCLDWTERRPHLGGSVASALCRHAFDASWIGRVGGGRAVTLTDAGRGAFERHLGITADMLADGPAETNAATARRA
jgi:DNA-binding transcriptional ArsR family regulator